MKKVFAVLGGFIIGVINSLIGAGGGMLAVPMLKRSHLSQSSAHASSIAVILPLTVISASIYLITKKVNFSQATPYLIPGIAGSLLGVFLLPRIPDNILRRIFGVFMLWAGIRMVLR